MRTQFSLLTILLATAAVGVVCWQFSPRSSHSVVERTDRQLDLAIVGDGFFAVQHPDGRLLYTRSGRFEIDQFGQLIHEATGLVLDPRITFPFDQRVIDISPRGEVFVASRGDGAKSTIGVITTAQFACPQKLVIAPGHCFEVSEASGAPIHSTPGDVDSGYIAQGWLERDTAGFWSYENPTLIVLLVILAAIAVQSLIFSSLITRGAKPAPLIDAPA